MPVTVLWTTRDWARAIASILEDRKGRPVSEVYPLHTEEGGRCTGNLVHLVFDRAR